MLREKSILEDNKKDLAYMELLAGAKSTYRNQPQSPNSYVNQRLGERNYQSPES